jgi:hypothetical protein
MSTTTTATDRVANYVANRIGMRGLDAEEVHSVHMGTDREAVLTLGDLRAVLEENERLRHDRRHFAEVVQQRNGSIDRLFADKDAAVAKANFYAGVLAEVRSAIGQFGAESLPPDRVGAIYNKVAWALDPLADHRQAAR